MPKRKPKFVLVWSNGTEMDQRIADNKPTPAWWDDACTAAFKAFNAVADANKIAKEAASNA